MSGFIDPDAHDRKRIDRLELLITEILADLPITAATLSPEARAILDDLTSANEIRKARAQQHIARLMAEDPIDVNAEEREGWARCLYATYFKGSCDDGRMRPWWGFDGHNGREQFYTCDRCGRQS